MISRLALEIDRWTTKVMGSWTSADTVVLVMAIAFTLCWVESALWYVKATTKILKDKYLGE